MSKYLLTVKQYAELEKTSGATIRMRMKRGTLRFKRVDGLTYVYIKSDKTIRKPRKKVVTN
jgi:hypothetical protein